MNFAKGVLGALMLSSWLELPQAVAAEISVTLPGNLIANADYRQGTSGKPAVFLLHGFMATHHLNLIQIIANELESAGYTVLAPTLTLKVSNRRMTADCASIHTHTMESDTAEIEWWLDWLKGKGFSKIVMIGHSTGALQIAVLLAYKKLPMVRKAIFAAPAYLKGSPFPEREELQEMAEAATHVTKGDRSLMKFHLSYCKGDFTAPADVFLSYKAWSGLKLMGLFKTIEQPMQIIMAEQDLRFGELWIQQYKNSGLPVISIPGANHFFDSPVEFEFLDQINNALDSNSK